MIDINAKKENCLARDKEFLSIYNDAFNFMGDLNANFDDFNQSMQQDFENFRNQIIKSLFFLNNSCAKPWL